MPYDHDHAPKAGTYAFTVIFTQPTDIGWGQFYECLAPDAADAVTQCVAAFPAASIEHVNEGHESTRYWWNDEQA